MSGNDLDNNQWDAVTAFLKFLQQEALVDLPINEADETEEEIQDEDSKSAEQKEAEDWINKLLANDHAKSQTEFAEGMSTADNLVLSWMLHLLAGSSIDSFQETHWPSNKKKINAWLDKSPPQH